MNIHNDVNFDVEKIDEEVVGHSQIKMHYLELLAKTDKEKADLKLKLDIKKAKLFDEFVHSHDGKKPTEKAIEAKILLNEEFQELVSKYNEITYERNLLSGVVEALTEKKKMIELYMNACISTFFADPRQKTEQEINYIKEKIRKELNNIT